MRLKEFFSTHKKTKIALVLLLVLLILIAAMRSCAPAPSALESEIRTVTLEKGTLTQSITVSGTIESEMLTNVTTTLSYKVAEIYVQVGDTVSAGDAIVRLDSSDIDEAIADEIESMGTTKSNLYESYTDATDAETSAYDTAYASEVARNTAVSAKNSALTAYNNALALVQPYQDAYDDAYTAAKTAANKLNELSESDSGYSDAKKDYDDAKTDLTAAETALNTEKAVHSLASLEAAYNAAASAASAAQATYEANLSVYDKAIESAETASENYADAAESDLLDSLLEQKEDCTIVAETDGVITSIDAVLGSSVSGTLVATLQDIDNLLLTTSFQQYDIQSIAVGQSVIITCEGVSTAEISGTISQLSMTADTVSDGVPAFSAQVRIEADSGLYIGMSAKAQVLILELDNIFTVPTDAIGTNDAGENVIYVQNGDAFEALVVSTGASNDYYTEISSAALTEGTLVRASAIESESILMSASDDDAQMQGGMFAFGGGGR